MKEGYAFLNLQTLKGLRAPDRRRRRRRRSGWPVCRCLTCKVHPKTPIISIAMHRYSEKTSHHGFRTRNFWFCSEPRFLNSPTGIILAAAAAARWGERRQRTLRLNQAFNTVQSPEDVLSNVLKLYDTQRQFGFVVQTMTTSFKYLWLWMNERANRAALLQSGKTSLTTESLTFRRFYKTEKQIWQMSNSCNIITTSTWIKQLIKYSD